MRSGDAAPVHSPSVSRCWVRVEDNGLSGRKGSIGNGRVAPSKQGRRICAAADRRRCRPWWKLRRLSDAPGSENPAAKLRRRPPDQRTGAGRRASLNAGNRSCTSREG